MPKQKNINVPIYSQDYYRFQKLVQDPKFQEEVRRLYSRYEKFDCPVPPGGFKKYKQYENWLDQFWKIYTQQEKIHGRQKENVFHDEEEIEGRKRFKIKVTLDLKDSRFPPMPWQFIEEILVEFNFDDKKEEYKDFLSDYLFRGKKEYREEVLRTRGIRNEKTGQFEWFIQIFPHTKRDHVIENWDFISKTLEDIPGYVGKNKPWENFKRDLYIHSIYKNLQKKLERRTSPAKGERPLDEQTWHIVKKRYPGLNLSKIKDAVSRVDSLDKGQAKDTL